MFNFKIKDTIAAGIFASLFGTVQVSLVNLLFSSFGFTVTPGWKPFAELFFPRYAQSNLGFWIGLFGQVCISAGWGVLIAFVLRKTGKDYWWLKGLAIGAVSWIATAGAALRMFGIAEQVYHRPADQIMVPLNLFLFGFLVAYIIQRFGDFKLKTRW